MSNRIVAAVLVVVASGALATGTAGAQAKGDEAPRANPQEIKYVKTPQPAIAAMSVALRKGDIVSARAAYERYDQMWNGIEVYVNYRNLPLYQALELDLQNKLAAGLALPQPNATELLGVSTALGTKYQEAVTMAKQGPALSPLFDDLAALRVARSDLRIVTAALNSGDFEKAHDEFKTFASSYPSVRALVTQRSSTVDPEISGAIAATDAAFKKPATTVDELKPMVAALTARYNYAVNLWNAAARNSDLTKAAYTDVDVQNASHLNDVRVALAASLRAWKAGDYAGAAQSAADANTAFAAVQPVLGAKSADASLRTTLASYTALSGAAGSETTVAAANKAATEAANVAEQVLVGQFWTNAKLQKQLQGLAGS